MTIQRGELDVFYRAGDPPFDKATVWNDPPERERLMRLIQSLTPDRLRGDAGGYLDALAARKDVRGVASARSATAWAGGWRS